MLLAGRRVRTVRARLRAWSRFTRWLRTEKGKSYPDELADVTSYLHDLASDSCGRSVPGEFAAALHFVERAGAVPTAQRFSAQPIWQGALRQVQVSCDSRAPPARSARMPTMAIMLALELAVCSSRPDFIRAWCWLRLIKVWCCLRWDDLQHVEPSSLRLDEFCLSLTISRSKTTGPGRRTRLVRAYAHRLANFSGKDWMLTGYELWTQAPFSFARSYFVPLPAPGYEEPIHRMAQYSDAAALGRHVLRALKVPVWTDSVGWEEGHNLLVPGFASCLWSEHSERHWLPSMAAACGISKSRRDFVGRWSIGHGSQDYVLTARQAVLGVQEEVACWICQGDPGVEESELLDDLRASTPSSEDPSWVDGHATALLPHKRGGRTLGLKYPRLKLQRPSALVRAASPLPAVDHDVDESPERQGHPDTPWWLSESRRGFRRLHLTGGCGALSMCRGKVVKVAQLQGVEMHDYCRHCWPADPKPSAEPEASDASPEEPETESSSSEEC